MLGERGEQLGQHLRVVDELLGVIVPHVRAFGSRNRVLLFRAGA